MCRWKPYDGNWAKSAELIFKESKDKEHPQAHFAAGTYQIWHHLLLLLITPAAAWAAAAWAHGPARCLFLTWQAGKASI